MLKSFLHGEEGIFLKSAQKAIVLLLLPAMELIFLRLYLKFFLKLKIGFPFGTDFDFILPVPTAFILLIYGLEKGRPCVLSIQRRLILGNAFFLGLFLLLNHRFVSFAGDKPVLFWGLWVILLGGVIVSAFCSLIPARFYFKNPHAYLFAPTILIVFLFPIYMYSFESIWQPFSRVTSFGLENLFRPFFGHLVEISENSLGYLTLKHPLLKVSIGQGCIGLDVFFLFTFILLFLIMLRAKALSISHWVLLYLFGIVCMCFVNLLRITLLFWAGVTLRNFFGLSQGTFLFNTIVHAHLGWCLYFFAIVSYFHLFFGLLERKPRVKLLRPVRSFTVFCE